MNNKRNKHPHYLDYVSGKIEAPSGGEQRQSYQALKTLFSVLVMMGGKWVLLCAEHSLATLLAFVCLTPIIFTATLATFFVANPN